MRNKSIGLMAFFCLNVQFLFSQTVTPSRTNFKELAKGENSIAPPKFLTIGNRVSAKGPMPLYLDLPPNAILKYQPDSLKTGNISNSVTAASPAAINNFIGLPDNATTIPPDVHGDAGLSHLMVVHNSEFLISDKSGTLLSKMSSSAFWAGVSPDGAAGDPHIHFNNYTKRWMMIAQSNTQATSALLVAVSESSDPTGNWARYAIDVDATNTIWFDYPLVGYNQNWLVIAANNFPVAGGAFTGSQIYIFDMATISAGATITIGVNAQRIQNSTAEFGSISPVTTYETGAASNTMYTLQNWNGTSRALRLVSLTGSIPTVSWNTGSATFPIGSTAWSGNSGVTNNNSSPQLDEVRKINSGDNRMCNAVMVNGKIWTTHHVFLPQGAPTRAAIQWWQLQTNGVVLQNGLIDDGVPEVHRTYPSIAVNGNEEVLIGYSKFDERRYPSAAYSMRTTATPLNTMDDEVIYKNGLASYWKDFTAGRCRWGDYSSTSVDPVTGRFWTLQEIAAARNGAGTSDNDSRWTSWWAEVAPSRVSASVYFVSSGVAVSETGTTGSCPRYQDIAVAIGIEGSAIGTASLNITGSGEATAGQDYAILTPSVSYTNGDNAVKYVTVRIFDDMAVETNETLLLSYSISGSGVVAASTGQLATINLRDDDVLPLASYPVTASLGILSSPLGASSIFKGATASQEKMQHLYRASDMTDAGFGVGTITALSYFFNTANATEYANFTINMANTSATTLATGTFLTPTFTQVYSANFTTPNVTGWSAIPLTSSFQWDGVSNILVQVCYENPALNADVQMVGTAPAGYLPTVLQRTTTGNGCSFTTSNSSSTFRPDIQFTMNKLGPLPETNMNATATTSFGPNAEIYIKNASNRIMAKVKNLTAFDYGCTEFTIDRMGTGAVQFWNTTAANYLMAKSFKVIPANANPSGSYEISLYYTADEVNGWQTATGQNINSALMVKVSNGHYIPDVTPATPYSSDVALVGTTNTAYGTGYVIKATFLNTSFSGFGVGVPAAPVPVTLLSFTGYEKRGASELNWVTTSEVNTKGFEIEKSFDGISFLKIGYVSAAGNSSIARNYLFTDPNKLTSIQFFRLKQIDLDGRSAYSNIVAIRKSEVSQMDIVSISNPFSDKVKIIFTEAPQDKAIFEVYDASGKLLFNTQQHVYSSMTEIAVPTNWSAGTYFLRILVNDLVFNEQLIKR